MSPGSNIFHTQVKRGRGTNISDTQRGGGTHFYAQGGTNNFYTQGGTNIYYTQGGIENFLMMMIIVENVSRANILSSEVRKPPAGLGP